MMSSTDPKSVNPRQETLDYYEHNGPRYQERTALRLDLAALREFCGRLPAGGRVLDAACGAGRDLRYLKEAGFRAEGFDASPAMVELARRHSGANVWRADMLLLSLPRESYDGIWANRALIHLPPAGCQRVMASFFSALRPGGILFVSIEAGEGELRDRADDPSGPARWIYRYRMEDFASLLRQSGFQPLLVGAQVGAPERVGLLSRRI